MATTSFVSENYARTITLPTGGTRPEPTQADREAERQADRVTGCEATMNRAGLTANDYDTAKGYGFPGPVGRTITAMGAADDGVPIWSARRIDAWREQFLTFAKKVK